MGTDARGRLFFPQDAVEHAYGGDSLKGATGKGGEVREWHKRVWRFQFKQRQWDYCWAKCEADDQVSEIKHPAY